MASLHTGRALPKAVTDLGVLPDPGYTFACVLELDGPDGRDALAWARDTFERAPAPVLAAIVAGWRGVLRLRLARRGSPDHVVGWAVESASPGVAVLGVASFAMTCRIVVTVEDGRVTHSTLLHYDRPIGRALWALADPIHRLTVPRLLRHAARSGPGGS